MTPVLRNPGKFGVSHKHVCPECSSSYIEKEFSFFKSNPFIPKHTYYFPEEKKHVTVGVTHCKYEDE